LFNYNRKKQRLRTRCSALDMKLAKHLFRSYQTCGAAFGLFSISRSVYWRASMKLVRDFRTKSLPPPITT